MQIFTNARHEFERAPLNSLGALSGFISLIIMVMLSNRNTIVDSSSTEQTVFSFGSSNGLIWLFLVSSVCYSFAFVVGVISRQKRFIGITVGIFSTICIAFVGAYLSIEQVNDQTADSNVIDAEFLSNTTMAIWGLCLLMFLMPNLISGIQNVVNKTNQGEKDLAGGLLGALLLMGTLAAFVGLGSASAMMQLIMRGN